MKKFLICLIAVLLIANTIGIVRLYSGGTQGYWNIKEIKAGEVIMTKKDGEVLGLTLGHFKLDKEGKAEVEILEEKFEGTWQEKDGVITVEYGEHTATGDRKKKTLTLKDDQTVVYVAHNNFR